MKLNAIFFSVLLISCNGNRFANNSADTDRNGSFKKQKAIDAQMAKGKRPDSEQEGPTFKEVLTERLNAYNEVENIDKSIIEDADTLQLHETYYCLHDSALIVPKRYLWGGDTTKNFITNNFVSKIVVIKNRDTLLNKVFKREDFDKVLFDALQKYATLIDANYVGYDKSKGDFAFGYSISIPLTDVGVPAYIIIDKKGSYRIGDEYTRIEPYKKN